MLKKSYGRVTARGILFRGNRFTCPRAIREQWFEKAALNKSWKIKIVYKHELDSVIYLFDEYGEHEPCYQIDNRINLSNIKLQRYFQSIQNLKAFYKMLKKSENHRNRGKKRSLSWRS
jgi:hypothetical protein